MNDLKSIQTWMQEALFEGFTEKQLVEEHINPSGQLNAGQRFAIYQRGYYARLIACLEGQYRALKHALGDGLFQDFAREYLKEFPSKSPTLAELGARFPEFLGRNRPDKDEEIKEEWIDFMIELARFEWDLYSVFDREGSEQDLSANHSTLDENLKVQRCLFLHAYAFPVHRYFTCVAHEEEPEIPWKEKTFVAIVRVNYVTRVYTLVPAQFFFLREMRGGFSVAQALESTRIRFESSEENAENAWREWRKNWIEAGFFVEG